MIASVKAVPGDHANFTRSLPFTMDELLGILGYKYDLTTKWKSQDLRLAFAMGAGVVAAFLQKLAVRAVARGIVKKTKVRCGKGPETLGEACAN